MQYRRLGRTDIEVSTVCMGCWAIAGGDTWGDQDEADAVDAIHASLDAGVNFFDTAEAYGRGTSEQLLAKGLGERRKDVVIATKVIGDLTPRSVRAACEGSLKSLNTDVIDLYQIHWPRHDVPIQDTLGEMTRLRDEGKIRVPGVSNFGPQDLSEALSCARVESDQVAYSLLWRALEFALQPACVEHEVSILCYSPLAMGLLTGKWRTPEDVPDGRSRTRLFDSARTGARHGEPGCEEEVFHAIGKIREVADGLGEPMGNVALAWLLAMPGVTSVLAGARNVEQARMNARAAQLVLGEDVVTHLAEVGEAVRDKIGVNMDPWQGESRIR